MQKSYLNFDNLPDGSYVDVRTVAAVMGVSVPTIWRYTKSGDLPQPHHLTKRTTRWLVGDLRQALNLEKAA